MLHLHLAEVVPIAPALPAAGAGLAGIFTLLLWVIALGLLLIWRRTVGALFEHLADIMDRVQFHALGVRVRPLAPFSGTLRTADWLVQQGLDAAVRGTETAATYLFHQSAALFTLTGVMLRGLAHDTELAFHWIEHHRIPRAIALALIPPLAAIVGIRALIHVTRLELAHGAARLRAQIHTLEREFGIAHRGIDVTKRDAKVLEAEVVRLTARVKALEKTLAHVATPVFFAEGLKSLDLKWLRCPSLINSGKKVGCFGFSLIESLLFAAWETFAVLDLCRFADGMTRLAQELRPLMLDFVDVEEALVGCHGATKPPDLSVPRLVLPPTNAGLKLAA